MNLILKNLKNLKNLKHLMNLVPSQKPQQIKFRFVKIIFIYPLRFVKTHENINKDRS